MGKILYSESMLADLKAYRLKGHSWKTTAKYFNNKYNTDKSPNALRKAVESIGEFHEITDTDADIATLRDIARTKRRASRTQRENIKILEYIENEKNVLEAITDLISEIKKRPKLQKIALPKKSKKKKNMTLELLLGDLHIGKKTDSYNLSVATERLKEVTRCVISEVKLASREFNVERIVVALLGDNIESATMHGIESTKACEFDNSRQVFECIKLLLELVLEPLASLGIQIDFICVPGNHDRTEKARTYVDRGENSLSYIVYKSLELFSKQLKYKNVSFDIPKNLYGTTKIYNDIVVYDHGDETKGTTKNSLAARLNSIQEQLSDFIHFYRCGHWHEFCMYDRGKFIVNESLMGPDSYSEHKGYDSKAGQTLNFYIETDERPTSFYRTFPIYLD